MTLSRNIPELAPGGVATPDPTLFGLPVVMRSTLQIKLYLLALTFVLAAGVTAKLLQLCLALPNPDMVFLAAVLLAAVFCGLGPSVVVALASVLVYDFFFVEPLYKLTVAKPQDVVSLSVFLAVAVLTSKLTARVRSQDLILREKAKTEAVMEAIEDGLIVLDPSGRVVHVNEVACAILQVERAQVLAHQFEDLATRHPHYLRVRAALREFQARPERDGERVEITLFLRGRDHYFVLRPTLFQTDDGAPAGLILALQDVTYLRDQESRREALMATLSHELRTPITSLGMAVDLLRRDPAGPEAERRDLVEAAHEDVARLQDVAQKLLDLSRARAMTIALERHNLDLREVLGRVVKIFAIQAREKGVTLNAIVPGQGLTITGDETKLMWAVSNLLSNALRYTPGEGRVTIEAIPQPSSVRVEVSDTGPGIPTAQRERIFERFAQAADSGEIGSAGLGLAIVRDIVQAHGGRIQVESAVGQGSRFVLELPRG